MFSSCVDLRLSARLSDGDSGNSSSDSDGGPGFFDGINDNPSEEAFLAASAGKKNGSRLSANGGAGHGADKDVADDGDSSDWDGDHGAEIAAFAERRAADGSGGVGVGGVAGEEKKARRSSSTTCSSIENRGGAESLAGVSDRAAKRNKSERAGEQREDGNKSDNGEGRDKGAPPANFSKVDPSLPHAELAQRFPLFLGAESRTVEVEAGQMLYLPAGWFHEVSQHLFSGGSDADASDAVGGVCGRSYARRLPFRRCWARMCSVRARLSEEG